MPRLRFPEPEHLPGITEFTDQYELGDEDLIVEVLKAIPGVWGPLERATRRYRKGDRGPHPEFAEGWVIAKMAQLLSGNPHVEKCYGSKFVRKQATWKA